MAFVHPQLKIAYPNKRGCLQYRIKCIWVAGWLVGWLV